MKYEYRTTDHDLTWEDWDTEAGREYTRRYEAVDLIPVPPDERDWRLVAVCTTEMRVLWTWEREKPKGKKK